MHAISIYVKKKQFFEIYSDSQRLHFIFTVIPETLYDFQIDIRPSNIPNAGHGAFLTFLGARVLKKEAENRTSNLMKQHIVDGEIATKRHLTASTMGGLKMDVTLTGRNLYRNENNPYWSKNREKALASNMDNNSNVRDDFDENSVQCEIHQEVQRLRSKIPTGRGIGFLGINSESDYVEDKDKLCSFPTGMFEIGRYGPFKPEVRDIFNNYHLHLFEFYFSHFRSSKISSTQFSVLIQSERTENPSCTLPSKILFIPLNLLSGVMMLRRRKL